MELFADPVSALVVLGALKIVGAAIGFLIGLPFIIGIIIGYVIGHR